VTSRFDLRIWAPALLGLACFLPRALPREPAAAPERVRSITLPQMHAPPERARERRYELDLDESSVRFLVEGNSGHLLAECRRCDGAMHFGAGVDDGDLELQLDLASLRVIDVSPGGPTVREVLGVLGDVQLELRARRVSVATSDLPGVHQDTWIGTVHLGPRQLLQPMQLWRCGLPGGRMHTQGHGTVAGVGFGLPARSWFGLFEERYTVTLGLDLAWRRARGN